MKMKKLVAGLLSAAMVFTSVSYNGYGVNQAEAAGAAVADETVKAEQVQGLAEYTGAELVTNASANSETNPTTWSDSVAAEAFKDSNLQWHSNYATPTSTNVNGNVSESNPIWIQTGFTNAINLSAISYLGKEGTMNNHIKNYELFISNDESNPTNWESVKKGEMKNTSAPQIIKLDTPKQAKWVRLTATSAYAGNGNYVAAKRIRIYEQGTVNVKLNNFGAFWDHEVTNETMATQTETDRWHFEIKPTNETWKDMSGTDFTTGKWHTDDRWAVGDEHCRIQRDGFRGNLNNENEAYSITWVAPKDGYYKFKQLGTASTHDVKGKLRLYKVDSTDASTTQIGADKADGQAFDSGIHYMKKGDKFRFAAEKNGNGKLINYCDGDPKVNWEVADCTKTEAARLVTEARAKLEAGNNKPQAVKDAYKAAIDALDNAVTANESTASLMTKITALEVATTTFESYVSVETLSISKTELKLNVGCEETLTCTFNPTEPTDKAVTWSSDDQSVATAVDGKVTAVGIGTTNVKVTWNADQTKTATCVVTVVADKTALTNKIKEAEELLNGKYTAASLAELSKVIDAAKVVVNDDKATAKEIEDAVKALEEVMSSLVRTYTVKALYADDTEVARAQTGEYNKVVTFTALANKDGKVFVGWTRDGKLISTEARLEVAIAGDATYKAIYGDAPAKPVEAAATLLNTFLTKRADTKANVKYVAQLTVPEGCRVLETGLVWTIQDTTKVPNMLDENGNVAYAKVKKVNVTNVNKYYQFSVSVNGLPLGRTFRGQVYAKVRDAKGNVKWVFSAEQSVTNN